MSAGNVSRVPVTARSGGRWTGHRQVKQWRCLNEKGAPLARKWRVRGQITLIGLRLRSFPSIGWAAGEEEAGLPLDFCNAQHNPNVFAGVPRLRSIHSLLALLVDGSIHHRHRFSWPGSVDQVTQHCSAEPCPSLASSETNRDCLSPVSQNSKADHHQSLITTRHLRQRTFHICAKVANVK